MASEAEHRQEQENARRAKKAERDGYAMASEALCTASDVDMFWANGYARDMLRATREHLGLDKEEE